MVVTAVTFCHLCGRTLTGGRSIVDGYGPDCLRRIRRAIHVADLSDYSWDLRCRAAELIAEHAIVHDDDGVFLAVSSCGLLIYEVDSTHRACSCPAGTNGIRCYHLAAATILAAV